MGKEIKNIIVLKNVYPNIFDEVIFVLNKNNKSNNSNKSNIVCEAKKIIDDYVNGNSNDNYETKQRVNINRAVKRNNINTILNISLFLSATIFLIMLTKIF